VSLTPIAAEVDYPFLNIVWTMLVIFAWVIWFWLLISIAGDLFRRHDIGGGKKALWLVFLIFVPFVGVLVYLIVNGDKMAERNEKQVRAQQEEMDTYIKSVAGGSAAEIERAKGLLDSGAITQAEFDQIKAKALA
jgi:type VI protein secretion system component VasK